MKAILRSLVLAATFLMAASPSPAPAATVQQMIDYGWLKLHRNRDAWRPPFSWCARWNAGKYTTAEALAICDIMGAP